MNSGDTVSVDSKQRTMNNDLSRSSEERQFVDDRSQTNCEATQSDKADNKSDKDSKCSNERRQSQQQRHNHDEDAAKPLQAKNEKNAPLKHYKGKCLKTNIYCMFYPYFFHLL